MKKVFADACYWIALLDPKDNLHKQATVVSKGLVSSRIVTTEMVLVEFLNAFGNFGAETRQLAAQTVKRIENDPNVDIVPQTSLQFKAATYHYASRLDKDWGVTDCASFLLMGEFGIDEALTADHHFSQAGFKLLLKKS